MGGRVGGKKERREQGDLSCEQLTNQERKEIV